MINDIKDNLWFDFHRALLFNITYNTKLICAELIGNNKLVIWVYMDREPTLHEKDVYYAVCGEITGKYLSLDNSLSEVHFITDEFIESEVKSKLLLFARCDYLDKEGNMI